LWAFQYRSNRVEVAIGCLLPRTNCSTYRPRTSMDYFCFLSKSAPEISIPTNMRCTFITFTPSHSLLTEESLGYDLSFRRSGPKEYTSQKLGLKAITWVSTSAILYRTPARYARSFMFFEKSITSLCTSVSPRLITMPWFTIGMINWAAPLELLRDWPKRMWS